MIWSPGTETSPVAHGLMSHKEVVTLVTVEVLVLTHSTVEGSPEDVCPKYS